MRIFSIALLGLILSGCASTNARWSAETDTSVLGLTSPTLTKFSSERDFYRYIDEVRRADDRRGNVKAFWQVGAESEAAATDPASEETCANPEDCDAALQTVTLTGSVVSAPSSPSITNTQKVGVDEGDIVKQIGQCLVILQDGRLFSVDTKPGGMAGLAVTGRQNVYRNDNDDTWYDEMLVVGRRVVVTGYSYDENATEISVLTLGEDGSFTREGTFYKSSDDYYDEDNYATRLVGDRLIIHTPIFLNDYGRDDPLEWPVVRTWQPENEYGTRDMPAKALFGARDIYRPVQPTVMPVLHTISICPLSDASGKTPLACDSVAFVSTDAYEFYVSTDDVWVWTSPARGDPLYAWEVDAEISCKTAESPPVTKSGKSALFRYNLRREELTVLGVRGKPINQFSLNTTGPTFQALVWGDKAFCNEYRHYRSETVNVALFQANIGLTRNTLRQASTSLYTPLPSLESGYYGENRFTDTHVAYAGSARYWGDVPDEDGDFLKTDAFIVPLDAPESVARVPLPHDVIRMERAGDDIVVTGYADATGLHLSLLDVDTAAPRLTGHTQLVGRYESEGRSHAFNSLIEADGSGLMGIPTRFHSEDANRYFWDSDSSDVSFLTIASDGSIADAGPLTHGPEEAHEEYECDVSCTDWYGNSRPIFTDGRVFALADSDVIEGVMTGGRIREIARVNITAPIDGIDED